MGKQRDRGTSIRDFVLPAGELVAGGPVAPGVGEYDPGILDRWREEAEAEAAEAGRNLGTIGDALAPQLARERADRAKAEADAEKRLEDAPFRAFLSEIHEAFAQADEEGIDPDDGRTELELSLSRIDRSPENGAERSSLVHKLKLTAAECLREGVPDLEQLAMDYAKETGEFGRYHWRIRAWLRGEHVKATTLRMNVARPPRYGGPMIKPMAETKAADPKNELRQTIELMAALREAVGGGDTSSRRDDSAATAAAALARLEAAEAHRRELRELEDRHRRELRELEEAAFKRGQAEGERTAREQYERRIWELERDLERVEEGTAPAPDIVDKIVSAVGGPQQVQGLIGAIAGAMARPAPKPRTPPQPMARINPYTPQPPRPGGIVLPQPSPQPQPIQPPPPPPPPPLPEPTPEAMAEAVEALTDAAALVMSAPDYASREDLRVTAGAFADLAAKASSARGEAVAWIWNEINKPIVPYEGGELLSWLQLADHLTAAEEENEMTDAEIKEMMVRAIRNGSDAGQVIAELVARVPTETLEKWRGLLKWVSTDQALNILSIPEDVRTQAGAVIDVFRG